MRVWLLSTSRSASRKGRREADFAARARLGVRRNSVFFTPPRAVLEATTHADATAASVRLTGLGLSQQSFALFPKLREVDDWVQRAPCPVYEVHPELSFAVLLGAPASAPKKTWAGMAERRRALENLGLTLDHIHGDAAAQRRPLTTPNTTAATMNNAPPTGRGLQAHRAARSAAHLNLFSIGVRCVSMRHTVIGPSTGARQLELAGDVARRGRRLKRRLEMAYAAGQSRDWSAVTVSWVASTLYVPSRRLGRTFPLASRARRRGDRHRACLTSAGFYLY
jgi:hypothetical protein